MAGKQCERQCQLLVTWTWTWSLSCAVMEASWLFQACWASTKFLRRASWLLVPDRVTGAPHLCLLQECFHHHTARGF